MKEVLNICLSQQAGHLQCHFNNLQESYLDYHGAKKSSVDPTVFLNPVVNRLNNTVSYTPRTILFDCNNGYGALGKYAYMTVEEEEDLVGNVERIQLQERVDQNEYQKLLDLNSNLPQLNNTTTRYWTDYTRLIYEPRSFNQIHDWVLNKEGKPGMKTDPTRVVKDFQIGVNDYKEINQDFLDDCVRVFLEQCDNLNGVNIISDMDSAWGGVSSEMLLRIRDDFLPKTAISTWGLYDDKLNAELDHVSYMTRIKSTISHLADSSLYIPLNGNPHYKGITSLWQTSSVLSTVFEAVNLLYAQRDSISMNEFINGVTMGTQRNFITDVGLQIDGELLDLTSFAITALPNEHFFSKSVIARNVAATTSSNLFDKLISNGTLERGLLEYDVDVPFIRPDSFPPNIFTDSGYSVSLGTSNRMRSDFKEMGQFISKMIKGDDRDFYIAEIENYRMEYEYGWSDDDEEYDD